MMFMIEAPVALLDTIRWVFIVLSLPVAVFIIVSVWEAHTTTVRFVHISYLIFLTAGFLDRIQALGEGFFSYSLTLYILGVGTGLFAAFIRFVNWYYDRKRTVS